MNKLFKTIAATFVCAVIACVSLTSCDTPIVKLGLLVAELTKKCPMDMGNGMQITEAKINESNDLELTIIVSEDASDLYDKIEEYCNNNSEEAINGVVDEWKVSDDNDFNELSTICKETNTNIVYKYVNESDGREVALTIPYTKF